MCLQIGYNVSDLMRVRIMHIPLGVLKLGRWRNLSDVELNGFFKS
jgi:16S rRNA U516 pseudouridylate synthase RsuA-like enzyme